MTVTGESEIPPPPEVLTRKEGYVGRMATLRIDDTIWAAAGAPEINKTVEVVDFGWLLKGDQMIPFSPQLEVGSTYILPLALLESNLREGSEWTPISLTAVLPLSGGVVDADDPILDRWVHPYSGESVEEIETVLADTEPDPLAVRYAHLDPEARARAVVMAEATAEGAP